MITGVKRFVAAATSVVVLATMLSTGAAAETEPIPTPEPTVVSPEPQPTPSEPVEAEAPVVEPTLEPEPTIDPEVSEAPSEAPVPEEAPATVPAEPSEPEIADDLATMAMSISAGSTPVYRFWSPVFQGHHYTTDPVERDTILEHWPNIWKYEKVAFNAYPNRVDGTVPVYRFWSQQYNAHFFTASSNERDEVLKRWPNIWKSEGIAFYVYPADVEVVGAKTVWRFWSAPYARHFFTADQAERDHVQATWPTVWSYEGPRFQVVPTDAPTMRATAGPEHATLNWDAPPGLPATPEYLEPGQYFVLDEADFDFGLGGSDSVRLYESDGTTLIDSFAWTSHASTSYARCPDGRGEFVVSVHPTKGVVNDCLPADVDDEVRPDDPEDLGTPALRINEIESNGGVPGDWIELVNTGEEPILLTGLIVRDSNDANEYTIPDAPSAAGTYQLEYKRSTDANWVRVSVTGSSYVLEGLTPGTLYDFRVRALFGSTPGQWSEVVSTRPVQARAPGAPVVDGVALVNSLDGVEAAWSIPDNGARAITGMQWSIQDVDRGTWGAWQSLSADARELTTQTLQRGATYQIRLRAANSFGWGAVGESALFTVPQQTSVPLIRIDTNEGAPILNRNDYVAGSYLLRDATGQSASGSLEIRGRGNSTWGYAKKPYRIKLGEAQPLLGMTADRDWALLANYVDRSFMRTNSAMVLGDQTNLAWTPDSRWVEVILNGRYLGLYQLIEHVEIEPHRINIDEMSSSDNTAPAVTGGYSLERDARLNLSVDDGFITPGNQPILIDDPSPLTSEQLAYISQYVADAEAAISRAGTNIPGTHYSDLIDVESFIDWYLIEELLRNHDAWFASAKMFKPRDGKLTMGPLWDFDLSMGTVFAEATNPPTGWYVRNTDWYRLLFKDPAFQQQVAERFNELKPAFSQLVANIDSWSPQIAAAAANDRLVWRYSQQFNSEVTQVKNWYTQRLNWMSTQFK